MRWKLDRTLEKIEEDIKIFSDLGNNYERARKQ